MNENLSEIIQNHGEEELPVFSEEDLNLPKAEAVAEASKEELVQEEPSSQTIGVTSLSIWFEKNSERFDNINEVKVSIRGVNPTQTLIMAVKNNCGEKDAEGNDARDLRIFENADTFPVLNLPATQMEVYSKGFQIVYDYNDDIAIKCYGIKMGLIAVFCNKINDILIPYQITRVKKKDSEIKVILYDYQEITDKLSIETKLEDLQILYKQSSKAEGITTNLASIKWLLERQGEITDINHLLQIDNVIISILE